MPSASLQSRIRAFEALSSSSATNILEDPISPTASAFHPIAPLVTPAFSNTSRSPSPTTPSLVSQTSLIDLKDWVVEDGPASSPSTFRHTLAAGRSNGIRESSKTPSPSRQPITNDSSNSSAPLINLESPPGPLTRPPLPPRRPSYNTTGRTPTQSLVSPGGENSATLRPPSLSDSVTIEHTYPPGPHQFGAGRPGHAPASSISSFHSVSLSSEGNHVGNHSPKISNKPPSFNFEAEADGTTTDIDTASIAESFENVSATSAPSPSTAIHFDWGQGIKLKTSPEHKPPSLPTRPVMKTAPIIPSKPLPRSISGSSSSTTSTMNTRRPPPPPPPYQPRSRPSSSRASVVSTSASDRSSILSNVTSTSRTSISTRNSTQLGGTLKPSPLLRPTPVPPAARLRYDSLFDSAVRGRQKAEKKRKKTKPSPPLPPPPTPSKGRQAGWRGLSVDLIADEESRPVLSSERRREESEGEDAEEPSPISPEEKLSGRIVKYVWSASRLDRQKLGSIWDDCDPQSTGFINRDAFIRGMWRIDEELRKAQLARRTSALTAASSQRIPHRPLPPPRPKGTTRLLI